jgi:hypothetical protein
MSGGPLLDLTRDGDKGFEVIETEKKLMGLSWPVGPCCGYHKGTFGASKRGPVSV